MATPDVNQPESHAFVSMSEAIDAGQARAIAENQAQGRVILDVVKVPGIPVILIENPFTDKGSRQLVELPYEIPEEAALVQAARDRHQELMDLYGSENVVVLKPSLEVALRHGHLFPDDLLAFMVQAEPLDG